MVYIVFTEEWYGGYDNNHLKLYNNREDAIEFLDSIPEDIEGFVDTVNIDNDSGVWYVIFTEECYGGYNQGYLNVCSTMEEAEEFKHTIPSKYDTKIAVCHAD